MHTQRARRMSRREFLGGLTLMGTAGVLGLHTRPEAAESPPETTKIRLIQVPGICVAPQYIAEELLKGEGFTDVQYLKVSTAEVYKVIASGEVDISMAFIAPFIRHYGIFYKKTPRGDVDHTFLTSLIDHSGTLRVQYLGTRFDPEELLRDLQALVREKTRS